MRLLGRTLLVTVFLLSFGGLVAGCRQPKANGPVAVSGEATSRPVDPLTVRVGYFPNVTHAQAVLGFSAGRQDFAKALSGVAKIETKVFNAGPAAMEALHAGALDLCFVGPTPAINAFAKGGDVTLIANVANGGSALVARQGAGITSVADLAGKSIAIPQLGNTQDAMLRHLLVQAGIELTDKGGSTRVLPVENPDVAGLFQRGELDAACVPEPWGSRLENEVGAQVVLDWNTIWRDGDYPVTVLVARKAFLKEHADVARQFAAELGKVTQELSADAAGQADALNAELRVLTGKPLKPEVLTRALGRVQFTTVVNEDSLTAMAEVMNEVGYAKDVPDLTGLVDPSYRAGEPPANQ